MKREDIEFPGHDGATLRGWLYLSDRASPTPGIIMSHVFSATKEMGLSAHAEMLADSGPRV